MHPLRNILSLDKCSILSFLWRIFVKRTQKGLACKQQQQQHNEKGILWKREIRFYFLNLHQSRNENLSKHLFQFQAIFPAARMKARMVRHKYATNIPCCAKIAGKHRHFIWKKDNCDPMLMYVNISNGLLRWLASKRNGKSVKAKGRCLCPGTKRMLPFS